MKEHWFTIGLLLVLTASIASAKTDKVGTATSMSMMGNKNVADNLKFKARGSIQKYRRQIEA